MGMCDMFRKKNPIEKANLEIVKKREPPCLWYPMAASTFHHPSPELPTRGRYRYGFPEGAVIHYTAGQGTGKGGINYAKKKGFTYILIDMRGMLWQRFPLDRHGKHAGISRHKNFPGEERLSKFLLGIEVINAGKVEPGPDGMFESWFGKKYSEKEVRHSDGEHNIEPGWYHKFMIKQEHALANYLLWMVKEGQGIFKIGNIFGHDEITRHRTTGRKTDPGAALSLTMPKFREYLFDRYSGHATIETSH